MGSLHVGDVRQVVFSDSSFAASLDSPLFLQEELGEEELTEQEQLQNSLHTVSMEGSLRELQHKIELFPVDATRLLREKIALKERDQAQTLIHAGTPLDFPEELQDAGEISPLETAFKMNEDEILELLIQKKANYSQLFIRCLREKDLEGCQKLVELEASVDCVSDFGESPLQVVALMLCRSSCKKIEELFQFLIEKRVKLTLDPEKVDESALHVVTKFGREDLLKKLLFNEFEELREYSSEYDIDTIDISGNTPLCYAVQYGSKEMVSLLIKRGANVNFFYESRLGAETSYPLALAVRFNRPKIVAFLLDNGAKVTTQILEWSERCNPDLAPILRERFIT